MSSQAQDVEAGYAATRFSALSRASVSRTWHTIRNEDQIEPNVWRRLIRIPALKSFGLNSMPKLSQGWLPVEVQFFRPCRTCRTIWSLRILPHQASAASPSIVLVTCFAKTTSRLAKITSSTYDLL